MRRNTLARIIAAAFLGIGAAGALAANITGIDSSAANVRLDSGAATVRFTVRGASDPADNCGYYVEYGDGKAPDTRVVGQGEGLFPRTHDRTFTAPGTYTVKASGQRVKATMGCNGEASTVVTVVPASFRERGRATRAVGPSCPEGWMLDEKSYNRETGAFRCLTQPVTRIDCGPGLRFYQQDGVIGCRERRDR